MSTNPKMVRAKQEKQSLEPSVQIKLKPKYYAVNRDGNTHMKSRAKKIELWNK